MKIFKIGMLYLCLSAIEKIQSKKIKGKSDVEEIIKKPNEFLKANSNNLRPEVKDDENLVHVKRHNYYVPTIFEEDPCLPKSKKSDLPKIELNMKINIQNDECHNGKNRGRSKGKSKKSRHTRSSTEDAGSQCHSKPHSKPHSNSESNNNPDYPPHSNPGSKSKVEYKKSNEDNETDSQNSQDQEGLIRVKKIRRNYRQFRGKDLDTPNVKVIDKNTISQDLKKEDKTDEQKSVRSSNDSSIPTSSKNPEVVSNGSSKDNKPTTDKNLSKKSGISLFGLYGNPIMET